jgi:hypothetical protein
VEEDEAYIALGLPLPPSQRCGGGDSLDARFFRSA